MKRGKHLKRFSVPAAPRLATTTIQIANRQRTKKIDTRLLKLILAELFSELKIARPELGISLVGAREMTLVNETFLQHEGSTDVITFDHQAPEPGTRNQELSLHGELFICVDEAILQAREFKTDWQSEVVRYVIHGVLHLIGYDDLKPALRRQMKRAENRLVKNLAGKFTFTQIFKTAKK